MRDSANSPNLLSLRASFPRGDFARALLALSLLAALVFWASEAIAPFAGRWFIKGLAIAALAAMVWRQRQSPQETWLAAALLCHSAGDILLEVARTELFLPAVGAFFCGHALYLKTFWQNLAPRSRMRTGNKLLAAAVLIFALTMASILLPHLPESLRLPLVLYMIALGAMAVIAVLSDFSTRIVAVGALLYLFSDALIGIDTFVRPLALGAHLIWPAYYAGQLAIVSGILQNNTR